MVLERYPNARTAYAVTLKAATIVEDLNDISELIEVRLGEP